jgi:hypothetical protein
MQKFFILCFLSILSFSSNAQFQKGNNVLGFGINFQTNSNEINSASIPQTNKSTGFSVSAELGFAKKENRLSGFFLNTGYGVSKQEYPSQPTSNFKSDNFNVGAGYFTRCYKSLGKNFFVFGEGRAGINYSQQNNKTNTSNSNPKQYGVNAGLYPGLAYKWNNHFLLELRFADFVSVGYSQGTFTSANNKKDIQHNFSLGSSLGLGYLNNIGIGTKWILK